MRSTRSRIRHRAWLPVGLVAGVCACRAGADASSDAGSTAAVQSIPQVVQSGGHVMTAPNVVPILFVADPMAPALATFASQIAGSAYWTQITAEYGVGPLTASAPIELDETPPSIADDGAMQQWLADKVASAPGFPQPTPETIYAVFSSTGVLEGEQGYHSDFVLPGGATLVYAVVATTGATDTVTAAASHELAESATDPDIHQGPAWSDLDEAHRGWELMGDTGDGLPGGEIADLCLFAILSGERVVLGGSAAQTMTPLWSTPWVPFPGIVILNQLGEQITGWPIVLSN